MRSRLNSNLLQKVGEAVLLRSGGRRGVRTRELGAELGVSEAEVVASGGAGHRVRFLSSGSLKAVMEGLLAEGEWMWLLRSEGAVLEKDVEGMSLETVEGWVRIAGEGFAACVEERAVRHVLWVASASGPPRSLQVYDREGVAILKLYMREAGAVERSDGVAERHAVGTPERMDIEVPLPEDGGTGAAGEGEGLEGTIALLEGAAERGEVIRLRVETPGAEMTVRHRPKRLVEARGWYNILDKGFNLHLRMEEVKGAKLREEAAWQEVLLVDGRGRGVLELGFPRVLDGRSGSGGEGGAA